MVPKKMRSISFVPTWIVTKKNYENKSRASLATVGRFPWLWLLAGKKLTNLQNS